ncbi:MAG: 5'-nucleotidase [Glaciecola sp.]|jgi:5'-nucleotidase
MNILLSNDDGVNAAGIAVLFEHLSKEHDVTVIAPDRNCSGMSNALSLHTPLRIEQMPNGFFAVNGTPSDCVQLGINKFMLQEPDLVVSGINHGANLGDDTIYSGTVAAALEGRHMGLPAIAVSLCSKKTDYFDTAAKVTCDIIRRLTSHPLKQNEILNINVPAIPFDLMKGIVATRLGKRHRAETMVQSTDPFGKTIYWYGQLGSEQDAGEGTDFDAVNNNYCSVTPLSVDMTVHEKVSKMNTWLNTKDTMN